MPATTASTGLAGLVFTDPHRGAAWAHAVVEGTHALEQPSGRRLPSVDVVLPSRTRFVGCPVTK